MRSSLFHRLWTLGLFAFIAIITGCVSFPVTVNNDPFKDVTTVSVDMWHTVLDSDLDNIRTLYTKTISKGDMSDPVATIVFVASADPYYGYHGQDMSKEAYVMVDATTFPLSLIDNKKERVKHNTMIYDYPYVYPYVYGYPHFFFYYPGVVIVKESRRYILTARIRLTPEIQSAIMGGSSYKIRLYLGETPVTLEATSKQLEALKKFIVYGHTASAPPGQ
ncbi:MAG TPA: hypothetical protein PLM53_09725 [Spirochaetota bacterium]|nr:hypothetical protein [Spirochaetota bacterium]HPC40919.1 hypothetical protein [Spirochaetota bacterium]HPL16046.1 hypothetical protein [Spirochaetota bacterium]HQF08651.1 hypothetical protein [Spirochaetota bacterium]HQH97366.1 hypothetical protein [Spirochaetota bacterium]